MRVYYISHVGCNFQCTSLVMLQRFYSSLVTNIDFCVVPRPGRELTTKRVASQRLTTEPWSLIGIFVYFWWFYSQMEIFRPLHSKVRFAESQQIICFWFYENEFIFGSFGKQNAFNFVLSALNARNIWIDLKFFNWKIF